MVNCHKNIIYVTVIIFPNINKLSFDLRRFTVNVEIFASYIFSHISRRALESPSFDVSENVYDNSTQKINWYVHRN